MAANAKKHSEAAKKAANEAKAATAEHDFETANEKRLESQAAASEARKSAKRASDYVAE